MRLLRRLSITAEAARLRKTMTNDENRPLWQPADLGRPIPDSPHAVSVCLPTWADNVGYEKADPRVTGRMQCGYPRFFLHPREAQLFQAWKRDSRNRQNVASPSRHAGWRNDASILSAKKKEWMDRWTHGNRILFMPSPSRMRPEIPSKPIGSIRAKSSRRARPNESSAGAWPRRTAFGKNRRSASDWPA